jgi:proteic killer suppression protein
MIRSFRHSGLENFFKTGSKRGIQPAHAEKLSRQLLALDSASAPNEVDVPGWRLHSLHGQQDGHWSMRVNGNWRLTFRFEQSDVVLLDYADYH